MSKKIIWVAVMLLLVIFLFPKPYTSSPGFVEQEVMDEFENNRKHCFGLPFLTNAEEVAADAPGKNLCFGWIY